MFEHKTSKLASKKDYIRRQFKYVLYAMSIVTISLIIGVLCYHWLGNLSWVDSLLNASMILGGMGPVNEMSSTSAKIFASLYSLYSGIVFLATIAVMSAPALHRFMHILHIDEE